MGQVAKAETTPFILPAAPQEEAVPELKLFTEKTDIRVQKRPENPTSVRLSSWCSPSDGGSCSSVSCWEVGLPLQGDPWASPQAPTHLIILTGWKIRGEIIFRQGYLLFSLRFVFFSHHGLHTCKNIRKDYLGQGPETRFFSFTVLFSVLHL